MDEKTYDKDFDVKNSFLYKLLDQQLNCLKCPSTTGFRWNQHIIHWALSLQYLGGKKCVELLRGKQSTKENRENKIENIGLYIPSNSTLKRLSMPESIKRY